MAEREMSESRLKKLKKEVLEKCLEPLREGLEDVDRLLFKLRARGVIDKSDQELIIRSEFTTFGRVQKMVDILKMRAGKEGEASLDILIDALNESMYSELARKLQRTLARAKAEELSR